MSSFFEKKFVLFEQAIGDVQDALQKTHPHPNRLAASLIIAPSCRSNLRPQKIGLNSTIEFMLG